MIRLLVLLAQFHALPQDTIVWADKEKTRPVFVPISMIERLPSRSAIAATDLRAMRAEMIDRVPAQTERCVRAVTGDTFGTPGSPVAERLQAGQIGVVGEVVSVTPGWNPVRRYATSLVTIRREDTVGPESVADDTLTWLMDTATASFGGGRLCTVEDTRTFVPRPGNRVLLVGRPSEINPGHVDGTLYPVIHDLVIGSLCPLDESTFVPLRALKGKEKQ